MNTFALYYLGPLVEKLYGSFRFLAIYLLLVFQARSLAFYFRRLYLQERLGRFSDALGLYYILENHIHICFSNNRHERIDGHWN